MINNVRYDKYINRLIDYKIILDIEMFVRMQQ